MKVHHKNGFLYDKKIMLRREGGKENKRGKEEKGPRKNHASHRMCDRVISHVRWLGNVHDRDVE